MFAYALLLFVMDYQRSALFYGDVFSKYELTNLSVIVL